MRIIENPAAASWPTLLKRPAKDYTALQAGVKDILHEVRDGGDQALKVLTKRFDGVEITDFKVAIHALSSAGNKLSSKLTQAIEMAHQNIDRFHRAQQTQAVTIATMPGVHCWRKSVGIDKVGLYIPGGTAPLFSTVLMLAIPAKIAGCKEIVLCTPPDKDGNIHPAILFAANLCGITQIYKVGGAQAIAAMTYGTESIPAVYKIFGPGNAYVTVAKQLAVQEGLAIDMPAGPSEVLVIADEEATPAFVAADLLSQAEHGPDSQVILVTYTKKQATAIVNAVTEQLQSLPRKAFAEESISNSLALVVPDEVTAADLINFYAPEHLIISTKNARRFSDHITNAGSVFLGYFTPESAGDYASGTNHTLPTYGYARQYSGVSLDSFVKKITYQEISPDGLHQIGPGVMTMAAAEGLEAHRLAVAVRLAALNEQ